MSRLSAILRDGVILNNRYRIVKQIGQGGFGRAYLAEDIHRYRELCVLKEFAPQVESDRELDKAEDLFERESGILYKLQHSQIPKFEALLQTRVDGKQSLFIVQEYIEGESYWELLKRQGKLTEAEVIDMIWELLPVLEYIHDADLIHRDISPDNLIRRESDGKTALIDFGCVKIAANAVSKSTGQSITLIGKKGYSPDEQLRRGQAFPCSDLYSLAATAIVLLTGKQPDELYDSHQGEWDWESQAKVTPSFKRVLNKMLAYKPRDRYQSASKVRQVLTKEKDSILKDSATNIVNSFVSRIRTLIVAPADQESSINENNSNFTSRLYGTVSRLRTRATNISRQATHIPTKEDFRKFKPWQWGIISAGVFLVPGLISFAVIKTRINNNFAFNFNRNPEESVLPKNEKDLQKNIYQRVESLDINPSAFYKQVDTVFHQQYPDLKGVQLTEKIEHKNYRKVWYDIATKLLNRKEIDR
ncbi:serine/threonine protein kinase [Waterburya agarophytonicola K14]|uniref:non-specific serine/threonine protein kinase n=1 Tax=Waterburya agarophytonicola KI4 TaxID=2874699 RepID=A0A964FGL7_9CYAN|nr:serine/threonine-protein kinase [Waterburya agarophytonicola]MCC0176774.1 serine/threonine protein kinase [Waterburya agarophytonicola KI4]